jgi:hypothetical protein
MNATTIIDQILKRGGTLRIQGNDIVLSAAQPLPSALVNQVRQYKIEILSALKSNPRELAIEFGRTGRIRIESDWAGTVWLVVSDEQLQGDEDGSVYFPSEIPFMVHLSSRERRLVDGFKRRFGGTIEVKELRARKDEPK